MHTHMHPRSYLHLLATRRLQELTEGDLRSHPAWQELEGQLHEQGDFQGNSPGTAPHQALLQAAAQGFGRAVHYHRATCALAAPAAIVDELLQEPMESVDGAEGGSGSGELPPSDSEEWMAAARGEVDLELQRRQQEVEAHQKRREGRRGQGEGVGCTQWLPERVHAWEAWRPDDQEYR
jgi:hypothetical protein